MSIALISALSLLALLASPAWAQFESTSAPVTLTSSAGVQTFQVKEGGTVLECIGPFLDNSTQTTSPTTTIQFEPTYSSCGSLFGQKVSLETNGCDYVFHLAKGATAGDMDIECPTSTGMQFTVGSICTYEYDTQTELASVSYSNGGTETTGTVSVHLTVKDLQLTRITNHFPFICPVGGSEGTMFGSFSLTGEFNGSHVGFSVD